MMSDNPYQAPREPVIDDWEPAPLLPVTYDLSGVKASLRWPATALIVLSVVALFLDAAVIRNAVVNDAPLMMKQYGEGQGRILASANVIGNALILAGHLVVIVGAARMRVARNHSLALGAAILASIPFCSPVVFLGIPFGIWSLVVLSRRGVIQAFRAQRVAA